MSWRKIPMKFPGVCIICNGKIEVNEIGMWAKGVGVKHEKCSQIDQLQCMVCGGPAGCPQCEFQDSCNLDMVSQMCICKQCSEQKDAFERYLGSSHKKFPIINS